MMLPDTITFNPIKLVKQLLVSPVGAGLGFITGWLCLTYLTKENAPAWVQAVGSVGAIWATAWVANRQQREQAVHRLEKDKVVVAAIAEIARASSMAINRLFELASSNQVKDKMEEFVRWIEYVERQHQTIKGIDLISLPKAEMIQPFLQLTHNIQSAANNSRKYTAGAVGDELRSIGISMKLNKDIVASLATKFDSF
jgi:hypothetical protein